MEILKMAIDANKMSSLDASQVIRSTVTELPSGELAQKVAMLGGNLVPTEYDEITLSYIVAGPGTGEIGTVEYRFDGNLVATLTLSYDGSNRLTNVLRS